MKKSPCCILIFAMVCMTTVPAGGAPPMTDDDKKAVVYRMYDGYTADFPEVDDISVPAAMALAKAGKAVFVDVRKPAEMAVSTLPDAISQDVFLEDPARYAGKTIVAYCTISYRSGVFAQEMAQKGIVVKNLRAGLLAWVLEGGKVYHDGKEVRRIHVYGDQWNYPPEGYESVVFRWWERAF